MDIQGVNKDTWDLAVKNPNRNDNESVREPGEILAEIRKLDEETKKLLNSIDVWG